jgi:hypothetical protein
VSGTGFWGVAGRIAGPAVVAAGLLAASGAMAQVTSNPARDQPTPADSPAPAGSPAAQPNGQVEAPSKIRSNVQIVPPGTDGARRETPSGTTRVPSLNELSGDKAKGVPGR